MASLFSIGVSGLNAAQMGLAATSNNIANAGTDGYSRQTTVQVDRAGQNMGRLTTGTGVDVVAVQRAYNQYLTQSVWSTAGSMQGATTTNALATTLNGFLKNSGNLQASLDSFYGGFNAVANAPQDPSARQAAIGSAQTLVAAFNTFGQQLDQQRAQINQQLSDTVAGINSATAQIAALNDQISQVRGSQPNALLDQRDSLIQQLSGLTGVSATPQPDGSVSVYSSSGQVLVSGNRSFNLQTGADPYDATTTTVLDPSGHDISSQLSGGTLGALLNYRNTTLSAAQNQLGRVALAVAQGVNAQQAQGLDLTGAQGEPLFIVPYPNVAAFKGNQGSAVVGAQVSDISKLTTDNYALTYTGSNTAPSAGGWSLATTSGRVVPLSANPDGTLSAEGLTFTASAGAQVGDSFQIKPTQNAASSIAMATTDGSKIAAAGALAAQPGSTNTGGASVTGVSVAASDNPALFTPATITFGAGNTYSVNGGASQSFTPGQPITANGWSLSLSGTPASGDSFTVGKNSTGLNDNRNALDMANLADTGTLNGGTLSATGAYAALTNQVGLAGSLAASNLATQTGLYNQAVGAQQSAAGVNLDEEAANLVKYQQSYQASAQVIATAQTLFTSLIAAIQA